MARAKIYQPKTASIQKKPSQLKKFLTMLLPVIYNSRMSIPQEKFDSIIEDTEQGVSLLTICRKSTVAISTNTFYADLRANPEHELRYAQAKENAVERELEMMHDLEDEGLVEVKKCEPKIANAIATMYRVKIDNLKWIASKIKAKKYGERLNVDQDTNLHITMQDDKGKTLDV